MRFVALALLSLVIPAHANLITNGSFEGPRVPDGMPYIHLNGTELPGWTLHSTYKGTVLFRSDSYDPVTDGTQAVQVEVPGDWISQSFATVVGKKYTLSFDLSAFTGYGGPGLGFHPCPCASILEVIAGPASETFYGSSAGFESHTVDFIADSSITTVKFENPTVPSAWGNYPHIDSVSVELIPEPNSAWFFIGALAALGVRGLTRRRA